MLLLTWHGTLVCLRQNGGGLVHLPINASEADTMPLDLDIAHTPPSDRQSLQSVIGPLAVAAATGPRTVSIARYSKFLCAAPERAELDFDREEANVWESFLPITALELDTLAALASALWIDRATREVLRGDVIGPTAGFQLAIGDARLDLESTWPARQGPSDAPATGFTIDLPDRQLELVRAEPRSSLLLDTKPWPPRARRIAEIMALAAHRQIARREPTQDVFEQDVAFLLDRNGPAGLDPLLARLLDAAAAALPADEGAASPVATELTDAFEPDDILLGWARTHTASWQPGSVDPDQTAAAFDALNQTADWAFVFHLRRGLVSMDEKPDNLAPSALQAGRAFAYLQFLQDVARGLAPIFSTTLCVCVDDMLDYVGDAPIFHTHKQDGERTLLLPDPDLLALDFLEDEVFDDPTDYADKAPLAVFSGATSGGTITPEIARDLSLPRLRAAAFFDNHAQVDFQLPNIVQCEEGAEDILRAQPFCQKPAQPWDAQLRHRMLIAMDGNGPDGARMAVALHANSALLKYQSPRSLYYSGALQPWLHYIPVAQDADVDNILAQEAQDPDLFARIAQNGRRFAQTYLTRARAERYTAMLLERYALSFVSADSDAAETPYQTFQQITEILVHQQGRGDTQVPAGSWAGLPGSGLAIEGFAIFFGTDTPQASLSSQAVLEGGGLSEPAIDGEFVGSRGQGAPIYGLCITVEDRAAQDVDIAYEARFVDGSLVGPCAAGTVCSSPSGAPLEAVLIRVAGRLDSSDPGDARQNAIQATDDFAQARVDGNGSAAFSLKDAANAALAAFARSARLREDFRFAFHHRPAGGPDVEVAVVALDSGEAGTVVYVDTNHDDPWTQMLRATSLVYVLEAMLAWAPVPTCQFLAELGDTGWRDDSASFCSANPKALLLPDPDFIGSGGYEAVRQMIAGLAIAWTARRPVVFWRGSTTGNRRFAPPADGEVDDFTWLPRLDMCHRARNSPHAQLYDVGIAALVDPNDNALRIRIETAGLMRPPAEREAFASCKAILVIDGNSNAWSALFCALLSGACVLRVESEQGFRQWYYDELKPWVHYVPVRADLSDMDDAVAWVMANDDAARRIAEASRALAESMTFETVVADAAKRLRGWVERQAVLF